MRILLVFSNRSLYFLPADHPLQFRMPLVSKQHSIRIFFGMRCHLLSLVFLIEKVWSGFSKIGEMKIPT